MRSQIVPLRLIISFFVPPIIKYKKTFWTALICYALGFAGANIISPIYYREIFDLITSTSPEQMSAMAAGALFRLVYIVAFVKLLYNIAYRLADFSLTYSQSNILFELRCYAFRKIQDHSYKFYVNTFQGSLVAKSNRYVNSFETLHDNLCFNFIPIITQLLGVFVVLMVIAPMLGLLFAVWCLVYVAATLLMVNKRRIYELELASADSKVKGALSDAVTNNLNIKMFASKENESERFTKIARSEEKIRRQTWNFGNKTATVQATLLTLLEVSGLYLSIRLWQEGSISTGTIVLITTYSMIIFATMWNLGGAMTRSMEALSNASEMVEIFEQKPDILDPDVPETCSIKEGKIVFDRATFAYGGDTPAVFTNFNLTIEPNQKVGLVGRSGVGKTTITKLLLRFVDLSGGAVTIDGQNIAKIKQDDLRLCIAYVPQEPVLFHRSLWENIAYGRPNASEAEILKASKDAHAHDFIANLPKGYATLVGERGVKLSGGERQRVAIARAMLKNAPILILDEATSSLDSVSEEAVQKAFTNLMKNRTTIVVAHRLSTVKKMDRIIVLDENGIAEDGTHDELLEKKGTYYNFWAHQSGGFIS